MNCSRKWPMLTLFHYKLGLLVHMYVISAFATYCRGRYWTFYWIAILLQSTCYFFFFLIRLMHWLLMSPCLWKVYLPAGLRRCLLPSWLHSGSCHLQQGNLQAEICNFYKFVSFAAGSYVRLPEITNLTGFAWNPQIPFTPSLRHKTSSDR